MKASEANLLKFLKKSPQFIIPIYQRNYSWTETQCRQLWDDILRTGLDEQINAHFMGSIVYIERALSTVTNHESLLVIDGQQRLTTCTLLIAALADYLEEQQIPELLDIFSARKLRNYYLFNPEEQNDRRFKLLLSETDKETLLAVLKHEPLQESASLRVIENYDLFKKLIADNRDKLDKICQGISKLIIVDVALDRDKDNPQLIFESMNSTGLELSQADLIRNYILMGLSPELQNELYRSYWRKMERLFGQEAYSQYFDDFMRHYLTVKTGTIPNIRKVYDEFKRFSISYFKGNSKGLVEDIYNYADYYCAFALDRESDPNLKLAFSDLRELKVDVAYPFLLSAYHDYKRGRLKNSEMLQVVRLIESYVFRRSICNVPTNSLNKTFASLAKSLNQECYVESLQAQFLLMSSYRRFPRNGEFLREIQIKDIYNFGRRSYFLRKLENHDRKETINIGEYSIEHIMPQNKELSTKWQAELGENWQEIQETYLHTLGNLTLTRYNSEYSDYSFTYKRIKICNKEGEKIGLAFSPLRLNNDFREIERWGEKQIKDRAEKLAEKAVSIWAIPDLDNEQLVKYEEATKSENLTYSINNFPSLLNNEELNNLFQKLRNNILALDFCVSEEYLKLYIAYKAETNFVDIIPQAKQLNLVLNMRFADIQDPRGLCRNITDIGKWGNGDVEVKLSNMDDLPYVMGLIRQAFEYQMERG